MQDVIRIVLVEDDLDDVEVLQNSLSHSGVPHELQIIPDGASAIAFFQGHSPHPHVIIMDLNLPKVHGREVLQEFYASEYAHIPLVILTTSSAKEDKDFSIKNHASSFIVKPTTREGLNDMVREILDLVENQLRS